MNSVKLRSVAAGSAVTLASGVLVLAVQPTAAAAWTTTTNVHDARLQVCKVKGKPVVKFRLNNKKGAHAHRGGIKRGKNDFTFVRAKAGKVSKVKQIRAGKKHGFSTLVGEINGPSAGGSTAVAELKFC